MLKHQRKIKVWKKIGSPMVVAEKFGKKLLSQNFENPKTKTVEEYYLFEFQDGAMILPLTAEGKVVAIEEYKQGCDRIVLGVPGGALDSEQETPEKAAERELLEETGFQAQKMIRLDPPSFLTTRNSGTKLFHFVALGCKEIKTAHPDHNEDIAVRLIPLDKWIGLCMKKITSSSAIVTTFKALPHLKRKIVK